MTCIRTGRAGRARRQTARPAPAGPGRSPTPPWLRSRRGGLGFPLVLVGFLGACGGAGAPVLTLGATTTLEDSGLLEAMLASFRTAHPEVPIRAVTGGTGEILALARRGDVDVVLSHDPPAEEALVEEGAAAWRSEVFWNQFLLAGPADDPAGVRGLTDAAAAFGRIAAAGTPFVSRGDDSGTHRKERLLWAAALSGAPARLPGPPTPGADRPEAGASWYIEAGVGMGEALRVSAARRGYVLVDRATFTALRPEHGLDALVTADPRLVNRYALLAVAGSSLGRQTEIFSAWLRSAEGRDLLAGYGRQAYGEPLFRVDAAPAAPLGDGAAKESADGGGRAP